MTNFKHSYSVLLMLETPKDHNSFLEALKGRDRKAIDELVRTHHEYLIRGALAQKMSLDEAEDVVAATWSIFFEKIENFEGRSQLKTYLFGIMYNKIREHRRFAQRFVEIDESSDILNSNFDEKGAWAYTPSDPDQFIHAMELQGALKDCMKHLSDKQQKVFYLKEIHEEETQNICELLNISKTNLKVILHRSRNQIRRCVEGFIA